MTHAIGLHGPRVTQLKIESVSPDGLQIRLAEIGLNNDHFVIVLEKAFDSANNDDSAFGNLRACHTDLGEIILRSAGIAPLGSRVLIRGLARFFSAQQGGQ